MGKCINLTVTEPNPSHVMDFRRYTSDQVVAFNRVQVNILREFTKKPLIHNYMGRITAFDHYDVGADLDINHFIMICIGQSGVIVGGLWSNSQAQLIGHHIILHH